MKARGKRTTVAIIIVAILLVAGLVMWVFSIPVARPTLSVRKFWENHQGESLAILCVSNAGNSGFFLQSGGGPDSSFAPGTHSPSYEVERKGTNIWFTEKSSLSLPVWFRVDPGQVLEFRVSLPADGKARRVMIPFKHVLKQASSRGRNQRTVVIPPNNPPSRLNRVQQICLKLLARVGLDPRPKLRSPIFMVNPKTRFAPMTQKDIDRIFPPPDLISPHTPYAERYRIGYALDTNSAVNRK